MRALARVAVAAWILSLVGGGLYACSSDETGSTPGPDSGGTPTDEAGSGTDTGTGTDTGGNPITPPACAILSGDAGRAPDLAPAACKDCAAEKCCIQLTNCYGGAPADGGFDGSNGSKTNCALYGECEANCPDNDTACEDNCLTQYGESAADMFEGMTTCVYTTAAPAGCQAFCPD